MADEVDSTSATGFSLSDELALENCYLGFGLMENQDDHVPFPLLSPNNNQEAHQPMSFDREYSNNGGGVHGSSDGWSAVSGALSFTTTYGPELDEQQLTLPWITEKAITHQQHSQKMDNSVKHHLSCGTHSSSLDSDGYDTASSESIRDEMLQQSKMKINHEISVQAPELGMEFSSEDDAYKFYKDYANAIGFSVRKGKYQRSLNGTIRKRNFLCSNEGFRLNKPNSNAVRYRRKETRTGCKAMVQITSENEKWMISHLVLEHNHNLEGSSQRYIGSRPHNSQTSEDHLTNRTIRKTAMVQKAGDSISAKFCNVDYSSYLGYQNVSSLNPEDAQGLINYLKQLQLDDPSFFYTLQVDAKSSLTNFFWRDGRSKLDYQYFGDVIVLDTTFRVGLQRMICAPFLGLNHHRQYVLLGCALLLDESKDSFRWLFGTLMAAMGGHQPKTILTTECQAMADAIKEVLPDTQHHLGMWYIQQTAAQHLSELYQQSGFKNLFNKCIFDCQYEEEFDLLWNSLVEQYNLRENEFLKTLHVLRKKWSPVFSKSTFFAGIQSTDDCKTIRTVFQSLMRENMTLSKFAQQYQMVAKEQRKNELDEDLCCNKTSPLTILKGSTLEKQAADVYTRTMFKLFQEELRGCLSVAIEDMGFTGTVATFKLKEEAQKDHIVKFDDSLNQITCGCKKYESVGILCVHILKVLNAKNIFQLPFRYILKRWMKSAKDGKVLNDHIGAAERSEKSLKVSKLEQKALNVITKSVASEDSYKIVEDCLDIVLGKVENVLKTKHTGHQDKEKDVEILNTCNEGIETQTVLSAPPFQKEAADHRLRSKSKRKHEDDVSEINCKSMDDCVLHRQPPRKATKDNEGSRAISSHSYFAGDCSQQPACISPRPPLPSPSTIHQFKGFSKPMGILQERKKQAPDAPVSRREMETMEMTIMSKMKEMHEGITKMKGMHEAILRAINENKKSLP
ncbi:protein FAR1-RELATED SEQUENCE 12-like isoform X2 [Durio zibethinus]|uniref:Protein FAR1-RELATED SEQUENCE n=1 Tax=Durio zibethinus TaxID=66656 RepID=A0A6P5YDS9_DURZI|nr:protein FAR1-RELATED SEQUENCE 12-like isoform X2 [Durio zibethinus]